MAVGVGDVVVPGCVRLCVSLGSLVVQVYRWLPRVSVYGVLEAFFKGLAGFFVVGCEGFMG